MAGTVSIYIVRARIRTTRPVFDMQLFGSWLVFTSLNPVPVKKYDGWFRPTVEKVNDNEYVLIVTTWGRLNPAELIASLHDGPPDGVELFEAAVEERRLELPVPPRPSMEEMLAEDKNSYDVTIVHGPTFYRHYAAVVAYPSPQKLWTSVARRLADAAEEQHGTRPDYRAAARTLALLTELVRDRTVKRLYRMTHGKKQPGFEGLATYRVAVPQSLHSFFVKLVEAMPLLGLGGSPGLGFGRVMAVEARPVNTTKVQKTQSFYTSEG